MSWIHRHEVHVAARHQLVDPGRDDGEGEEEPADRQQPRRHFRRLELAHLLRKLALPRSVHEVQNGNGWRAAGKKQRMKHEGRRMTVSCHAPGTNPHPCFILPALSGREPGVRLRIRADNDQQRRCNGHAGPLCGKGASCSTSAEWQFGREPPAGRCFIGPRSLEFLRAHEHEREGRARHLWASHARSWPSHFGNDRTRYGKVSGSVCYLTRTRASGTGEWMYCCSACIY